MKKTKKSGLVLECSKEMVEIYVNNHVSRSAAELSYFLTLSIFPMLICLHAMLIRFLPTLTLNIDELRRIIPLETLETIQDYLTYVSQHNSRALLTAGILGMATTSAASFRSIHHIMGEIQGASRFRGVFALLFSFVFSLLFLAACYFAALVMVTGSWLLSYVSEIIPALSGIALWSWLRFPLMLIIFILLIYGIYRITAPANTKTFFPGASSAAILLVMVSMLFSWFISMSSKYPLIYGSLASIIIFMLWMYFCGQILIMGNALNVVLRRHKPEKPAKVVPKAGKSGD